jgi:rhodanese-related sulfurtransferase
MMVMVFVGSGLMLLWSYFGSAIRGIKEVGTLEALQLINHKEAVIVDVREQKEYDTGHLLNSKLIPLGTIKDRIGELEKYRDRPVVFICASGQRSKIASAQFKNSGFTQTYSLTGGVAAWRKADLPLEK